MASPGILVRDITQMQTFHALNMLSSLVKLQENGTICDFTVKVGVRSIAAHRVVLSACSDYFRAMCTNDMKESSEGVVEMKDVEFDAVRQCIHFIYSGETPDLTTENARSIIHSSNLMQITYLTNWCFENLLEKLCVENCLFIKGLADSYSNEKASDEAELFAIQNFEAIVKTTGFFRLHHDDVSQYVKSAKAGYEISWNAVLNWIKHDVTEREKHTLSLISFLGSNCSPKFLASALNEPIISNSEACTNFIISLLFSDLEAIRQELDSDNFFVSLKVLRSHQSEELKEILAQFCETNFSSVSEKQEFLVLDEKEVCLLFDRPGINYKKLWKAITRWIDFDAARANKIAEQILSLVGTSRFHIKFLLMTVLRHPIAVKCKAFQDMVIERLYSKADALKSKIDLITCFDIYTLAKNYPHATLDSIKTAVDEFMAKNFVKIAKDERLNVLEKADLLKLLQKDYGYFSEDMKWTVALKWIKHDDSRKLEFLELLRCLKLDRLSSDVIQSMKTEPMMNSLEGQKFIIECFCTKVAEKPPCIAILSQNTGRINAIDVTTKRTFFVAKTRKQDLMRIFQLNGELFLFSGQTLLQLQRNGIWNRVAGTGKRWSEDVHVVGVQNAIYFIENERMSWYDLRKESWVHKQFGCGLGTLSCSVTTTESAIYCLGGGMTGKNAVVFDVVGQIWSDIMAMPVARDWSSAVNFNGILYITGGAWNKNIPVTIMSCYNPVTNSWQEMKVGMKHDHMRHATCVVDGKIYVIGGTYDAKTWMLKFPNYVEVYDRELQCWQEFQQIPDVGIPVQACILYL